MPLAVAVIALSEALVGLANSLLRALPSRVANPVIENGAGETAVSGFLLRLLNYLI